MTEREHPQNSDQVEDVTDVTDDATTEQDSTDQAPAVEAHADDTQVIDVDTDPTWVTEADADETQVIEAHDDTQAIDVKPGATQVAEADTDETQVIRTEALGTTPEQTAVVADAEADAPAGTTAFAAAPTTEFSAAGESAQDSRPSAPDHAAATPVGLPPGGTSTGAGEAGSPPAAPQSPYTAPVPPVAPAPRSSGPRAGTVIWGLIVVAVGAAILASAAGLHIDFQLAFIGLLAVAGVGLLVSSLVNAARRRDRSAS